MKIFPFGPILFLVFLTLKLTGHIDWSWWWVTAPLWVTFLVLFAIAVIIEAVKPPRRW